MLHIDHRAYVEVTASDTLSLCYDERKKSRLRVRSDRGVDVALALPQGSALRDGDLLEASTGEVLRVRAAPELLSEATTSDPLLFARAVYHLGSRQMPLQLGVGVMRYRRDATLDQLLTDLGLAVSEKEAPFDPEGCVLGGSAS